MATIERIGETRDVLGEGPVWDVQEQALYWVDIRAPAVQRYDWRTRATRSWALSEMVGSLAVRRDAGLLLAMRSALSYFDPGSGTLEIVAAPEGGREGMRFNDGKCDRQGRFWVGSMHDVTREPRGSLYRLDARGCSAVAGGIRIPNSLAWSPDGRTMYFADSLTRIIHRYAFDPVTGTLGERTLFCTIEPPAIPDGATVDAEGCLWCALYDGWRIACIAPDGRMVRSVELPVQRPTSAQFGGPNLDVLLVTTATQRLSADELAAQPLAGALLAVDVGVKGVPEARYAG